MILATIGMNDAPYGPMFEIIEQYAVARGEDAVFQVGNIDYKSAHFETFGFLTDTDMQALFDRADLIVAHAGVGTILNGLKRNIPLVLVPREVVCETENDQQGIVARKVESMGRGVTVSSLEQLVEKIEEAKSLKFDKYVENTELCDNLSTILSEFDIKLQEKRQSKKKRWF